MLDIGKLVVTQGEVVGKKNKASNYVHIAVIIV